MITRPSKLLLTSIAGLCLLWSWLQADTPAPRTVDDVPIAWWAWRNRAPAPATLQTAFAMPRSETLFLRAGQIDFERGKLKRIRAVEGNLPQQVTLHLVYHATRSLLAQFEQVDPAQLAAVLATTFWQDYTRAQHECAEVSGIQLDIDAPVRLLPHYRKTLLALRQQLPVGMRLSITGLPAWLTAPTLSSLLSATDFWIPQCYGAEIARQFSQTIAIASPKQTEKTVAAARRLGHPFYAGLAAYGYTIQFATNGQRLVLRGDLDPAAIAAHPDLTLRECNQLSATTTTATDGEWRCVYQALRECLVDGLVLRPAETLVVQMPSAASLRANASAARTQGGKPLLGLCIFRLPDTADPTNLSALEIAAALADQATQPKAEITAELQPVPATNDNEAGKLQPAQRLRLTVSNTGSARAYPNLGALAITLALPASQLRQPAVLSHFTSVEPLCHAATPNEWQACSPLRASALRLDATHWQPGTQLQAEWLVKTTLPATLPVTLTLQTDDGRNWQEDFTVAIKRTNTQ